jgi:hypothetical protein
MDMGPQLTFDTPEEAVERFVAAVESQNSSQLLRLLGPGTESLVSSGDAIADHKEREAFLNRYRISHQLVAGGPNDLTLLVGADRWPLPIPLIFIEGRWMFDGAVGMEEILLRRIGANELRTIKVMRGFVAAQKEYAASSHDGLRPGLYASKLRSEPGRHDGLYWQDSPAGSASPAGPFLAAATAEGYSPRGDSLAPYHGYLFRQLTGQGPAANGGIRNYVSERGLTNGFAMLAQPAKYGASGIMTFLVNQDGIVWQRDLGPNTEQAAAAIVLFNPDHNWTPIAGESSLVTENQQTPQG